MKTIAIIIACAITPLTVNPAQDCTVNSNKEITVNQAEEVVQHDSYRQLIVDPISLNEMRNA